MDEHNLFIDYVPRKISSYNGFSIAKLSNNQMVYPDPWRSVSPSQSFSHHTTKSNSEIVDFPIENGDL